MGGRPRLSKKWLAPLFRGVHSSLAPTARPGSYARKPLLRKAFCGFDAHVAKSDQSLRGLRPPNPRGFFDRLGAATWVAAPPYLCLVDDIGLHPLLAAVFFVKAFRSWLGPEV